MKRKTGWLFITIFLSFLYINTAFAKRLVMITGANRGLGLLLSEQFLKGGDDLIAIHRKKTVPDSLKSLKSKYPETLTLESLELTDLPAVKTFGEKYQRLGKPINILINNAGIYSPREPIDNTFQNLSQNLPQLEASMKTNAEAPMLLASSMLDNIVRSTDKMILFLGSAGSRFSVDDSKRNRMGFTYVMSKSALHKAIDQAASDLKNPDKCVNKENCNNEQQVTIVGIDPGWIDTDMGKGSKSAQPKTGTAEKAAANIYKLIISGNITHNLSGQLIDASGNKLGW